MKKLLKSLNELTVKELPLETNQDGHFITESELESYLIKQEYNIYQADKTLSKEDVIEKQLVLDSVLISDAMYDLGFESKRNKLDEIIFVKSL